MLEMRDIPGAWEAAPVLTEAGADPAWLEEHLGAIASQELAPVIAVLTSTATTAQLTSEIEQDVDVRRGLKSTLTMLAHKQMHYTVTVDWPPDLPTVPGNPGELNQVWTNLLDNAADALTERSRETPGEVAVRVTSDDVAVSVRITDNGPGMTPDITSKIFDPSFTTKAVGSGTGMGLDVVWRIVTNAHHGRVAVESEPGRGSTFVVELPRRAAVV